jgi:hypothetical protein
MHGSPAPSLTPRRIGEHATGVAHEWLDRIDTRLARATGRPSGAWLSEARHTLRERPLATLGVAVAAGYVLGKLLRRL